MAIQFSRQCQYGAITYWRITDIQVNCDANTIQIALSGWMDATARGAGALPFPGDFPGTAYTVAPSDLTIPTGLDPVSALKTAAYNYVEAQPEWAGGVDC